MSEPLYTFVEDTATSSRSERIRDLMKIGIALEQQLLLSDVELTQEEKEELARKAASEVSSV